MPPADHAGWESVRHRQNQTNLFQYNDVMLARLLNIEGCGAFRLPTASIFADEEDG
jgi:hypothetical protein